MASSRASERAVAPGAGGDDADAAFAHLPYPLAEASDFVREVLLPGGPHVKPRLDAAATRYRLQARGSPIHRFGIFTTEPIAAGERVIEYTGQLISYREGQRRRLRPHLYLFWVTPGLLLDGAIGGSGAEFVNHSCEPNVEAEVADGRVFFVSRREIAAGEELLLDYKVHGDAPALVCHCGSASCRGFLNAP